MKEATPRVIPADGLVLARVLETMHAVAPEGLNAHAFAQFDRAQTKMPWARAHQGRVALVDGDNVLASARSSDLSGTFDGRAVRISAIGSVFTDPTHGDATHTRVLIDHLLAEGRRSGADIAMLFPGPEPVPSALEGFEYLPIHDLELHVVESSRRGAPMTMVRGGDETDVAPIVALGQTRADPYRFHLDRDVALITHVIAKNRLLAGLAPRRQRELEFVVAEEGMTAVAYVVISRVGASWTIEECGDRDPSGARVGAILQALIAREPAERRPVIRAWLPSGFVPPQVRILSTAPVTSVLFTHLRRDVSHPRLSDADVLYWRSDLF